jgi:hypothetical protein
MPACPKCNRPLATGARSCVYCAQGNPYQRREQLAVPKGATGYKKTGFPWGKLLLLLVVAVGIGAVATKPAARAWVMGLVDKVKAMF